MGFFFLARIVANTHYRATIAAKIFFVPFFGGWYFALAFCLVAGAVGSFYSPRHGFLLLIAPYDALPPLRAAMDDLGLLGLIGALLPLAYSHFRSFVVNYLRGQEHEEDFEWMVFKPFGRIILLVLVVIPGGIFLAVKDSAAHMLLILVVIKITTDLVSHGIEHRKAFRRAREKARAA